MEVPSTSIRPFEFSESFKEQPFSIIVASKQSGPFQLCNLAAKLGEMAFFGTYLKFMVEQPNIKLKALPTHTEYLNNSRPEIMNFVTMALIKLFGRYFANMFRHYFSSHWHTFSIQWYTTEDLNVLPLLLQLLAILGEQFIVGNEIWGAVISVRPTEDIISLWNRTASDNAITARIRYVPTLNVLVDVVSERSVHIENIFCKWQSIVCSIMLIHVHSRNNLVLFCKKHTGWSDNTLD